MSIMEAEIYASPVTTLIPPKPVASAKPLSLEERTDVTIDELEANDPGYPFDLVDGKVVRKMAGYEQSRLVSKLNLLIGKFLELNPIGELLTQLNYRLFPDNKLQSRAPDISFVRNERLSLITPGYPTMAPDLAIEIISPNDRVDAVFDKAGLYVERGVQEVWLVLPQARQILVYTPGAISGVKTTLQSSVLAGFVLNLKDIFPEPPQAQPES